MAKMYGLGGVLSGKLGNTVLAITNGIQIARQYQPVVSNPKSSAQMMQRAKANLAGRISKIVPRSAILGLGKNNRERRAALLRNILLNSTSVLVDGVYSAKLQPQSLTLSDGNALPIINVSSVTVTPAGNVTLTMARITNVDQTTYDRNGGLFVFIVIDDETGNYDYVATAALEKAAYPGATFTQAVGLPPVTNHSVYVYFLPFEPTDGPNSTVSKRLKEADSNYAADLILTESASSLNWGHSEFIGVATPVQAKSDEEEKVSKKK